MNTTYYDITKEYPHMYRVIIYKTPFTPKPQKKSIVKMLTNYTLESSLDRSIRRTRRTLHDYVKCNEFELFVTFTFDPKKVNRYDIDATYLKMQGWLWRQRRKNKDFKYLIVPEKHKDGAIHFHALMSETPFKLKKTNVIQDSKRVYNITAFRYGFTNATKLPIDDNNAKSKAGNYIAKYITKDMVTLHNKRRYWASRNLQKPKVHYNSIYNLGIESEINHNNEINENEYNVTYEITKDLFD